MNRTIVASLVTVGIVFGFVLHALGQTAAPRRAEWLESKNVTRLEWLTLQKQADEGHNEWSDTGVQVHFYFNKESLDTGEIMCELLYLPKTSAEVVRIYENGVLRRFEMERELHPWAHVKIIKRMAE